MYAYVQPPFLTLRRLAFFRRLLPGLCLVRRDAAVHRLARGGQGAAGHVARQEDAARLRRHGTTQVELGGEYGEVPLLFCGSQDQEECALSGPDKRPFLW